MPLEIHLVSHTHWDREWYHTAEVFRQRLVALVDALIADPPRRGDSFLLDGQAIVLEDYVTVRPERKGQLTQLLRDQRIEAGPWYVLADELIPTGEALVRNLLVGRAVLSEFDADAAPVLYCPDSFGHPAVLPEIAAGFGLAVIVLWRGYGSQRWPRGDVVQWRAPSGVQTLLFHLPPDGYEFGSSLPCETGAAETRWERVRSTLAQRSTVGVTLLQNGADHQARQPGRDVAIGLIQSLAAQGRDRVLASSMRAFSAALVEKARAQRLQTVIGELRDSYGYTWTLQGTFATRAAQKRRNAIAERTLLRQAEPWSALAWFKGSESRHDVLNAAWKTLLSAQPHDTLCGTAIDDVAAAMDVRVAAALAQAGEIARDGINDLLGRDIVDERARAGDWTSVVVVRNDSAWPRDGVALIDLAEKIADENVGPGSANGPDIADIRAADAAKPAIPEGMQLIESRIVRDRIESPGHYPDNDIVRLVTVAALVGNVPALSLTPSPWPGEALPTPAGRVRVSGDELANTIVNCRVARDGVLTVEVPRTIENILRFEDREDRGDLYTPSIRREVATAECSKKRIVHRGPLVGEVQLQWKLVASTGKRSTAGTIDVTVRMTAASPLLEFDAAGTNASTNHRLRIGIATGLRRAIVVADAAFGPVERVPVALTKEEERMEHAPSTAPLHRYVSLYSGAHGATVFSDGLAEYEVDSAGIVWITLVRAVGDLSRNDLPERPGHAGWPVDTPAAQSIGPFEARFALLLHGARTPATLDEIEREAERFLHPLRGTTIRSAVRPLQASAGPELAGSNLVLSAIKQSEDRQWLVLRCVNVGDRDQSGRWTLPRPIRDARLARLDETPQGDLAVGTGGTVVEFTAGPRAVVTLLVR